MDRRGGAENMEKVVHAARSKFVRTKEGGTSMQEKQHAV